MDETESEQPQSRRYVRIDRGWQKYELIRLLAKGEHTQTELAEKYGCSQHAISAFQKRYVDEIMAVVRDIDNEFAGIWAAQKANRIMELQSSVEEINKMLEDEELPQDGRSAYMAERRASLKDIANELGQLTNRSVINLAGDVRVRYLTDNVDDADLV